MLDDVLPRGSIAPFGCVTTTLLEAPDGDNPETTPVVLADCPVPVPICVTARSAVSAGLGKRWSMRSRRLTTGSVLSSARRAAPLFSDTSGLPRNGEGGTVSPDPALRE